MPRFLPLIKKEVIYVSKILKVKVKREPLEGGGTHYVYPPEYDASKIRVLAYESVGDEKTVMDRGKYTFEFCIGIAKDEDAPAFLASPDIVEISKDDAIKLGSVWHKQTERVVDDDKVIRILAKKARGEGLTESELNAIKPNHPEVGINKLPSFEERLEKEL